ncbi:uncharacterized protein G6M90_00g027630 [Metarhizium brunneum]|uniref:Uncharacterized protein n=1 Tax=Metarhizium brunneum TaxID=500148 RepID=A0A7D5UQ42_9HYPO|nr:hypothetical protein G6M90_00g027630 [Metarhizium brunneum]
METETSLTAPPNTPEKNPYEGVCQRKVDAQSRNLDPTSCKSFYLAHEIIEISSESDGNSDEATVPNSPRVIEEDINEGDQPSENASRADAAEDEVNDNTNKAKNGSIVYSNGLLATECLPNVDHARFANTAEESSSKYSIITMRLDTPASEKYGAVGQKFGEGGYVGNREGSSECSNGKLKRAYDRYESPPDDVPEHDLLSKRRRTAKRL